MARHPFSRVRHALPQIAPLVHNGINSVAPQPRDFNRKKYYCYDRVMGPSSALGFLVLG